MTMMAEVPRAQERTAMPTSSIRVLLPVKELAQVKRRLAAILTAEERQTLVLTMLRDVIAAVQETGLEATVLSPDPRVLMVAQEAGAATISEDPRAASLNAALEQTIATTGADARAVLVILPDTPLVTADEIQCLLAALPGRSRHGGSGACNDRRKGSALQPGPPTLVLAPDRAGRGTNALVAFPPSTIPLAFGVNSLACHLRTAEAHGILTRVCHLSGLGLDVDQPEDLAAVAAVPGSRLTQRLLLQLRISERINTPRER
jgi:2-phospho-L-lactate guanylyltransferase